MTASARPPTLRQLLRFALVYGVAGFGGGYSVLAQVRRDLVERRRWLGAADFMVLAELSKSLPGSPATSLLALVGRRVAGVRGGVLAAAVFLAPSVVLMIACGAAYSHVREARALTLFFDGMNAAMVGVVGAVTIELSRSALRSRRDVLFAVGCGLLLVLHVVAEPVLAGAAAVIGAIRGAISAAKRPGSGGEPPLRGALPITLGPIVLAGSLGSLAALARVFTPIGITTFGGGLAMIPAIEHTVVGEQGWLDPKAFADAIALGQLTPGPIAICSTFIGYRVAGVAGALVATVAMFGPSTALAIAAGHSVERFRSSAIVGGALRTLAPAVIGMLGAATLSLGRAAIGSPLDAALATLAFVLLLVRPVSPLWPMLGAGLVRLGASVLFALS